MALEVNDEVDGKKGGNAVQQAAIAQAAKLKKTYESVEFTVPGGGYADKPLNATDLPGSVQGFKNGRLAHTLIMRTDQDVSIKLNANTNESISLAATEGSLTLDAVELSNVFVTAPAGAQLKFILV